MSEATPRITAAYLEQFQGQAVRVVGRVIQLRGDHAVIDAGGSITVHLTRDSHLRDGNAVEIVGKVKNDLSIQTLMATDFGDNFDFTAAEAVVDVTHRYKDIFYGDD
ncbi:hypothetical protein BLS_006262 [Venturia inaequalis]|uniref:Replication factor A protein 3 n=1 Tax=Venturia inaequalis TaxID=5025 RepID=A0A8H3VN22_VENIN|nr:hypothetical protein EG328_009404 [Venturia inaequalis]KAE9967617.1 hypothetical protein BLS_006262 [Venturia inaequalis]KAE9990831.1 hypothetical protein EG327_000922 [Venturia inaequalis]RDI76626.1 hypothetical protein Vi05172_g13385 [Venturia inaequalis]